MKKLAVVLLTTVALSAGCAGGTERPAAPVVVTTTVIPTPAPAPSEDACRAAIAVDYEVGWPGEDTWPPAARKPVCAGFNRPTLNRLIDEAIDDIMSGTTGP